MVSPNNADLRRRLSSTTCKKWVERGAESSISGAIVNHCLQRHPGHGKTPDQSKERPSPRTTQYTQRERRVGTRDEEKYRRVFDDAKHPLGLAGRQGVIAGGGQVKQDHGGGEETRADYESRISALCCLQDKKRGGHECRDQSYPVADAVGDFFPWRLLTLGHGKRFAHDTPSY